MRGPEILDGVLGTDFYAWAGGSISYPWQTFSGAGANYESPASPTENEAKHNGYGWIVRQDEPCIVKRGGCVTDARIQFHAIMAPPGAVTRFHSFSAEARVCNPDESQCGTIFAMRLANDTDRGHVTSAASDNLKGLFELLPVLRTGEAIIVGEAVSLPVRTLIDPPAKDRRPDSVDPRVAVRGSLQGDGFEGPGGWNQRRDQPDYAAVVRQWRTQNPYYSHNAKQNGEADGATN